MNPTSTTISAETFDSGLSICELSTPEIVAPTPSDGSFSDWSEERPVCNTANLTLTTEPAGTPNSDESTYYS